MFFPKGYVMNDKCLNKTFPKVNNTSTITILVILSILIGFGAKR